MAEANKTQMGDGADNYGSSRRTDGKGSKTTRPEGCEAAAAKGIELHN